MTYALDGIKVLDLCRGYPPAFATMHMADFGADVIKVDPVGYTSALPGGTDEDKISAYTFIDRNKRSIKINMRSDAGRELIFKLARHVDILIENSRPGTMEKLGIGYTTLKEINPRLIYCQVSGYGQTGPYKDIVGHDANFMGIAGTLSMIGPTEGPPCWPSNIIADFAGAGLHPLIGVLIAVIAREKTGQGQLVDISYTDAVFSLTSGYGRKKAQGQNSPDRRRAVLLNLSYQGQGIYNHSVYRAAVLEKFLSGYRQTGTDCPPVVYERCGQAGNVRHYA
jgi:crotonobetainyl-CoA:carnitine CoA-transferase CaiB-like acyl-CoA transferase